MIWVGTSGFQYPEWKGTFYPATLSTARMLPYYAERFPTTEINYSFYRVPSEKTLTAWNATTPREFRFSFKAPKEITHVRKLQQTEQTLRRFEDAIKTLDQKLGAVLFQLPPAFKKDLPCLQAFLGSLPRDLHSAFEFRHPSWFGDEVFSCLRASGAALCIAESEKLSTPIVFTGGFGYFRLRREDYTESEIAKWAELIVGRQPQLKEVYVYFKHEESGVGPKFAKRFVELLS
jgi:uncharacterized protein YecE (DUF72 family)